MSVVLSSPVNAGLWRNRVLQAVEGMKKDIATVKSLAVAELMRRVILRTPYGRPELWKNGYGEWALANGYKAGALRANWNVSIGSPDLTYNPDKKDPTGGKTIALGVAKAMIPAKTYFISNATPYAARIEYDGYSQQSPVGMARISIVEWQSIVALAKTRVGTGRKTPNTTAKVL